jgi:diacylglycerol kinase
MRHKTGSEMRKLTWLFAIPVVVLVIIIVAYFAMTMIVTAEHSAKRAKTIMIEQTVQAYEAMGKNFGAMNFNPAIVKSFSADVIKAFLAGNVGPIYDLVINLSAIATPSSFVALIKDGKVYDSLANSGVKANKSEILTKPPPKGYTIINEFGNLKGTLIYVFYPIDLTKMGINTKFYMSTVFDVTKQVKEIDSYFTNQRNSNIVTLTIASVAAVLVFFLLSTIWLRYLIRRFVSEPIEELNTAAEQIVDGTYEGEVKVNPKSDYAAIQGLLKSGQLVLRKLDKEMEADNND